MQSRTVQVLSKGMVQFVWMILPLPFVPLSVAILSERNHSISKYHLSVASIIQQTNKHGCLRYQGHQLLIPQLGLWTVKGDAQQGHVTIRLSTVLLILFMKATLECALLNQEFFKLLLLEQCPVATVDTHIRCPHKTALAHGEFVPRLWNERQWQHVHYHPCISSEWEGIGVPLVVSDRDAIHLRVEIWGIVVNMNKN